MTTHTPPPAGQTVALGLDDSELHGRGVHARQAVAAGAAIEVCPVLPLTEAGREDLADYCIDLEDGRFGIPLGYGALYNHADDPNATWEIAEDLMRISALRAIEPGEEITIHYGGEWFGARGLVPRG